MKRSVIYSVLAICLLMLSSCLGDPATSLTLANQAGVIGLQPRKVVYVKGGDVLSSEDFQKANVDDGECILFDYAIDMGLGDVTEDGITFKTATIYENTITEVDQWPMFNNLGDTTKPADNELTLSLLQSRYAYIRGKLFLFTEMSNHKPAQLDSFALSYNPAQSIGDEKIYDFYLRTICLEDDTLSGRSMIIPCAFDIQNFVDAANVSQEDGTDVIRFRINYVSGFDKDTTKCMWKSSDVIKIEKSAN
ncbi:hypothetical protein [Parabacteroides sp. AM08-6]|uniref:hypothetical protein n=1 Tax=Parabacteroides sp. AM08-6 TaxID=2292053 RepID=UPI000F000CD9|nr:hypothetical protein [Parabacteroides sp. AM08-6]RHJ77905.1 hypothetical protein DW103_15745 [Parabacteroides sp. AM08-6]